MHVPIEIYQLLEDRLGRDEAKVELKQEMRDELSTKEDIANLRTELKDDIASLRTEMVRMEARLDRKFTILWLITLFVIVFLNQNALEFLARVLGLLK